MGYAAIEDYGIVGNLETCALVSDGGSIDWCCFPHLESESVFAAILDDESGGRYRIQPAEPFDAAQEYVDRTNVLQTHFSTADGEVTLTDFMPVLSGQAVQHPMATTLVRKATCTEGSMDLSVEFSPRFDYARADTVLEAADDGVVAHGAMNRLGLRGVDSLVIEDDRARGVESLAAGETAWHRLEFGHQETDPPDPADLLQDTIDYWRDWTHDCDGDDCPLEGPWHDDAVRSALLLKLLIHQPTGAIAAAPTTSLPEEIGGVRNWDYRFSWLRDSALTIHSLFKMGHENEAEDYFDWCREIVFTGGSESVDKPLYQPLYGLHGETDVGEEVLDHLEGYRGSRPVRVGNAASGQLQLDIYGELVLSIYETTRYGEEISQQLWEMVVDVVEFVREIWRQPGSGIWEVRHEPKQFVHSKVMCWVAIDRAIELAEGQGFDAPLDDWRAERQEMRETILERGYDEQRGAFVRTFDSGALDATALRIPMLGFLPGDDPRVQSTIDAVMEELATEDGLVYRYLGPDGVPGGENPFLLCSFWLVENLVLAGRVDEAHDLFERLLEYTSPLGLLAEEIAPEDGSHRGNYPQAFSHIGLINSAIYISQAEGQPVGPEPVGDDSEDVEFATGDRSLD